MNIHWAETVSDQWEDVRSELARAFETSRSAARNEESFVYVVHHDDLLGRRGYGNAMVATGLLSAARTAAIEGARKGWTANVIAFDDGADREQVQAWAERVAGDSLGVTGELIRVGSTHLGKALP
ncbi:MAG: hypothetical protein R3258_00100 [Acidimicrobiia bacterium]|nr:hypothetical protein [Acidimicrobiia bacterium]